jgi:hypothetical protein
VVAGSYAALWGMSNLAALSGPKNLLTFGAKLGSRAGPSDPRVD